MKFTLTVEYRGCIGDMGNHLSLEEIDRLVLMTDSQDVKAMKEHLGNHPDIMEFDGFFVELHEGDYSRIFTFFGNTPLLWRSWYEIIRRLE